MVNISLSSGRRQNCIFKLPAFPLSGSGSINRRWMAWFGVFARPPGVVYREQLFTTRVHIRSEGFKRGMRQQLGTLYNEKKDFSYIENSVDISIYKIFFFSYLEKIFLYIKMFDYFLYRNIFSRFEKNISIYRNVNDIFYIWKIIFLSVG